MSVPILTPDAALTDPAWSWLHDDGSITPMTEDEMQRLGLNDDDEPTLA